MAFGVVIVLLLAASAQAQSLAEVARKEEARRKSVASPGKVYTNDSVRPDPSAAAPAAAAPPPAPSGAAPPSPSGVSPDAATAKTEPPKAAPPADPKKDEAAWRDRIKAERDALSRAQLFAEALQSRINGLTADFTARDDPAQRSVIAGERQKSLAELERVKKEIAQHTKAIADIQEEARRAGVPAGWVR